MISMVSGTVQILDKNFVILDIGNISIKIFTTPNTLKSLTFNKKYSLHTHFLVKEASFSLYGFITVEEKNMFESLLGVSGVGAKTILSILSIYSPKEIINYLKERNNKAFLKVPGVGVKSSQRIILELSDKFSFNENDPNIESLTNLYEEVVQGLVGLGWEKKYSKSIVDNTFKKNKSLKNLSTPELLKEILSNVGKEPLNE